MFSTTGMTTEHATIVRSWIVGSMTLILDNDEEMYEQVVEIVRQHRSQCEREGTLYDAKVVGEQITNLIHDLIESEIKGPDWGPLPLLVREVLDLGDQEQWWMLGSHYTDVDA